MTPLLVSLAVLVFATTQSTPAPDSKAARIVAPLREIGHVHARTAFCKAFVAGAQPAVASALDYETRLVQTIRDERNISFSDELSKFRTLRVVEADLNALADLVASGRAELRKLRAGALAQGGPASAQVVAFVDALDGAKGHQLEMARKLAAIYGALAEHPIYNLMQLPSDDRTEKDALGMGDWLETDEFMERHDRTQSLFEANDKDFVVAEDLERAGEAGRKALAIGGC